MVLSIQIYLCFSFTNCCACVCTGHSDDEEADFDSDTETSGDSEIDSEEDRKDLDELGKLLDQGERFDDIETGKRVVRARRKKKQNSANPNRIKCTECPKTFADEAKKEIHFKRKHTPGKFGQLSTVWK